MAGLGVATTGRAAHREDLLRNLGVVAKDECLILESGLDFDNEAGLREAFWHATTGEAAQVALQPASARLRTLVKCRVHLAIIVVQTVIGLSQT